MRWWIPIFSVSVLCIVSAYSEYLLVELDDNDNSPQLVNKDLSESLPNNFANNIFGNDLANKKKSIKRKRGKKKKPKKKAKKKGGKVTPNGKGGKP